MAVEEVKLAMPILLLENNYVERFKRDHPVR